MYLDAYFEAMDGVLAAIRETQRAAIVKAGRAVARSLAKSGTVQVMDTGHMLRHEAYFRAGGLMALVPFSYDLSVENPIETREVKRSGKQEAELEARKVALALDSSTMRRGDVLIVNSNSGRTPNVIEVARQCKDRGITTVAISSAEQMRKCAAAHPSGKKLFDVADICIDNCGPHGDALVKVHGNEKMCPGSGIGSVYVFWAIQAEAVQRLEAKGIKPSIFRSVHVSGHEYIEKQRKRFLKRGI